MSGRAVKIYIEPAESGQKILSFLQNNLRNKTTGTPLPAALLHRLIRSGQVRVNSSRIKPFHRLSEGDEVRIPPLSGVVSPWDFVCQEAENISCEDAAEYNQTGMLGSSLKKKYPYISILDESADYLVLCKPAGLPVHKGTHHDNSLIDFIHDCAGNTCRFKPTLVHRLDKATSGILLVAKNYSFLRKAQDALQKGLTVKEYLAWTFGKYHLAEWTFFEDFLEKRETSTFSRMEKVEVIENEEDVSGKKSTFSSHYCCCKARSVIERDSETLLHIHLITGRTHQIRVQLSSRGHPIIGDTKYGGLNCHQGMLLHAFRFTLPGEGSWQVLPSWRNNFKVDPKQIFGVLS